MRELPDCFLQDLMADDGLLHPILERVKRDHTLMLALRNGYINVYYRGGNLLKLGCNGVDRSYKSFFDPQYDKSRRRLPTALPTTIRRPEDVAIWVEAFPRLKEVMDFYFARYNKPEREFQQLVARENNCSAISNETEYFVTDIEFADSDVSARFDMLAIRWLASERKDGNRCRAALMEMKYGDHALDGTAGLLDHLKDINEFLLDKTHYRSLLGTMEAQFRQLSQLDLLKFNRCKNGTEVKLHTEDKPEVIIILANHNPRSARLERILQNLEEKGYGQSQQFDLKFLVTSFAGYGLHANSVFSLGKFRQLLHWLDIAGKKEGSTAVDPSTPSHTSSLVPGG